MLKNLIFDWSGTIIDDIPLVYEASNKIFAYCNKPLLTASEFRDAFELPYMNFYNKYIPEMKKEDQDRIFIEIRKNQRRPETFPGTKTILKKLKSRDKKLFVFTD